MSTTMQSSQVGIAAHIGGMGTGTSANDFNSHRFSLYLANLVGFMGVWHPCYLPRHPKNHVIQAYHNVSLMGKII